MKAKTAKNAAKGKKAYTTAEIREAIAYWKGRLASLNEAEETPETDVDDVDDGETSGDAAKGGLPGEKSVQEKAKSAPAGVFNPNKRFYRMHLAAVKKVKKALAKLLHDRGLKSVTDGNIQIENTAIDDSDANFHPEVGTALVTIKVTIEKAQLKGLRKLFAAPFEDEHAMDGIDEGKIWNAIKAGFKGVKDAGVEKIADANEKLRQNIGVPAMQEYFNAFFGKILASKVTKKNVFAGGDDKSVEGAEFVYCASVSIKS